MDAAGFNRPPFTPKPRPAITRAAMALLQQLIARKQAEKDSQK